MSVKKSLLVAGISAVALGTTYFIWKYMSDKKKDKKGGDVTPAPTGTPTGSPTGGTSKALSTTFPIKFGTFNNQNVVVLQKAIKVTPDGDWGKLTEAKMKELGSANKTFKNKTELDQFIFEKAFGSSEDTPTYYTLP